MQRGPQQESPQVVVLVRSATRNIEGTRIATSAIAPAPRVIESGKAAATELVLYRLEYALGK